MKGHLVIKAQEGQGSPSTRRSMGNRKGCLGKEGAALRLPGSGCSLRPSQACPTVEQRRRLWGHLLPPLSSLLSKGSFPGPIKKWMNVPCQILRVYQVWLSSVHFSIHSFPKLHPHFSLGNSPSLFLRVLRTLKVRGCNGSSGNSSEFESRAASIETWNLSIPD